MDIFHIVLFENCFILKLFKGLCFSPNDLSFHVILRALVQKLIFQVGAGGHFRFEPLEKNAGIFWR